MLIVKADDVDGLNYLSILSRNWFLLFTLRSKLGLSVLPEDDLIRLCWLEPNIFPFIKGKLTPLVRQSSPNNEGFGVITHKSFSCSAENSF